jgi:hypothetical protein
MGPNTREGNIERHLLPKRFIKSRSVDMNRLLTKIEASNIFKARNSCCVQGIFTF